jgi:hypothetical protein
MTHGAGADREERPRKVALVGAGRMGAIHGASASADPRLDLAWLIDPRADMAAALAELAAVIIASSTDTHLELTLAPCGLARRCSARSLWTSISIALGRTPGNSARPARRCS